VRRILLRSSEPSKNLSTTLSSNEILETKNYAMLLEIRAPHMQATVEVTVQN